MSRASRVLIRTLPLSNGNYGGILQAYALQRVLADLGLSPATDMTISKPLSPLARAVARAAVRIAPAWVFTTRATAELRDSVLTEETSRPLAGFVADHIVGVDLYRKRNVIDPDVLADHPSLVVGSDQVWRHRYGDVKSYLFDFVDDPDVRMISYAASFGHDHLQGYNRRLVRVTRALAQRFDAVSVRERAAVQLCHEHWDVAALEHVDPTMLLTREHYAALASAGPATDLRPGCLTYLLDESHRSRALVDTVCEQVGLTETRLIRQPRTYAEWRAAPQRYLRPTVATWLKAFADANFVVTDSFHGTIFAVLNNKPFLTMSNANRGSSRFDSLLGTFGLERRLVAPEPNPVGRALDQDIDWRPVNELLAVKRAEGIAFLRDSLVHST